MTMSDQYQTSDTFIATTLVASGIPIASMSRESDGRVYFYFDRENGLLDQVVARYWNKTLLIDAQTLLNEGKILKHRIANFR